MSARQHVHWRYYLFLWIKGPRETAVSTGLKEPVVAVIEYNFEREGEIVAPAGAGSASEFVPSKLCGF